MKFLVVTVLLASLLVVPVAYGWSTDADLRAVTSQLAGREVGVRCVSDREGSQRNIWGIGMVDFDEANRPSNYVWLYSTVCDGMKSFLLGETGEPSDTEHHDYVHADALSVVLHEVGHLRGIYNEGRAQRYAMRNFRKTTIRLGASPQRATRMLRHAIVLHLGLSREFKSQGCRWPSVGVNGHLVGCK